MANAVIPFYPASVTDVNSVIAAYNGAAPNLVSGETLSLGSLADNFKVISLGRSFDGFGDVIPVDQTFYVPCPANGTISGYDIITPDSGTCTIKVWKVASGTSVPTVANDISTSGFSLATGKRLRSTNVSNLTTTAVAAYDLFAFTVTAVSGLTKADFILYVTRT